MSQLVTPQRVTQFVKATFHRKSDELMKCIKYLRYNSTQSVYEDHTQVSMKSFHVLVVVIVLAAVLIVVIIVVAVVVVVVVL